MSGVSDEPAAERIEFADNSSPPHHSNPSDNPMSQPLSPQAQIHGDTVDSEGLIKRVELVRVMTKSLYTLGYKNAGAVLEKESGIQLHSDSVNLFRQQVLSGNWDGSLAALHELAISDGEIVKSASFLILEQKFLQLLRTGEVMDALEILRNGITPLGINTKRVHELSSCLIGFGENGGEFSSSPTKVLEELQKVFSPDLLVAEKRLEHLIEQALTMQIKDCPFHNSFSFSLYADHRCGKDQIPSQTTQVLQGHTDEVWFMRFSNSGRYLASSSRDKSTIIWEVDEEGKLSLKHTLRGHKKPVLMAAWNPDDTQLLTCGFEEDLIRWDVQSGQCIQSYRHDSYGYIACGFCSDGKELFSCLASMQFFSIDLNGLNIRSFIRTRTANIADMAVTKDKQIVIFTDTDTSIQLLDIALGKEMFVEEEHVITTFSLSKDENFLLVDLVTDLETNVYIWHRGMGNLLEALEGHSGAVNCVSWNPVNPHMLASASDDRTIRIWGTKRC